MKRFFLLMMCDDDGLMDFVGFTWRLPANTRSCVCLRLRTDDIFPLRDTHQRESIFGGRAPTNSQHKRQRLVFSNLVGALLHSVLQL